MPEDISHQMYQVTLCINLWGCFHFYWTVCVASGVLFFTLKQGLCLLLCMGVACELREFVLSLQLLPQEH